MFAARLALSHLPLLFELLSLTPRASTAGPERSRRVNSLLSASSSPLNLPPFLDAASSISPLFATLTENTGGGVQSLVDFRFSIFRASCAAAGLAFLPVSELHAQDRQCSVTGPLMGWTIAAPVRRDSSRFAFNPKYHFAGRSASSISINRGLCFNPSACRIIVSWSCRKNFSAKIRKIQTGKSKFQAATKSIRQRSLRTGVTVARLENHSFPLRISSVRIFGKTKSIVVVTGSPVYLCSIRYGALFELGVCGLIRNPFGIGSNFFSFS